jgi:hypothetical protein
MTHKQKIYVLIRYVCVCVREREIDREKGGGLISPAVQLIDLQIVT